jgi:hypothetical protein
MFFMIKLLIGLLVAWGVVGGIWYFLFNDKDDFITKFKAGPIIWFLEWWHGRS